MPRKKHQQLTLEDALPVTHGGRRKGSGRRKGRNVAHRKREPFSTRIPQHVTLRLKRGVPSLRQHELVGLLRTQIALTQQEWFRIVHFTIETNHMHFLIEVGDPRARGDGSELLASGVQLLTSRVARRLNRAFGRRGKLFDDRYHSRSLTSPLEVRRALVYVLNNERHHADERGLEVPPSWFDPYSSAMWFDGWSAPLPADAPWKCEALAVPRPTAEAKTWLLRTGWKKHGLLDLDEVPGRRAARRAASRRVL